MTRGPVIPFNGSYTVDCIIGSYFFRPRNRFLEIIITSNSVFRFLVVCSIINSCMRARACVHNRIANPPARWKIHSRRKSPPSIARGDRGAIRKTHGAEERGTRIRTVNGNVNRNNRGTVQWERQRTRHLETSELRLHFNPAPLPPIYEIGHIVKRATGVDTRKPPISLSMLLLRNAE